MTPAANLHRKKIFFSYSGPSRERVEQILERLKRKGYDTYLDRRGNRLGDPVSAKVESELQSSTLCLVYYSARYAVRHACQFELMQALTADRRSGGEARTLVINPETSKAHIRPAMLKDKLYVSDDSTDEALEQIVKEVELRLEKLSGTYQGINFNHLPRTVRGRSSVTPRVRRYGSMWALESALHARRYPLTHQPTNGIAVLTGLRGVGKTSLADDYVSHFAYEYQAVVRVDLTDATGTTAETALREAMTDANNELEASKGNVLVIVDNVPAGVPYQHFSAWIDSPELLLLVISEHAEYAKLGQEVRLAGLTDDEAIALFYLLHSFDQDDDAAKEQVRQLADAVDNHVMAVSVLAAAASSSLGLTTLTEHVGRVIDGSSDTTAKLSDLFADRFSALDEYQSSVLRLLAACGPAKVPARLIRDVLTKVGMDGSRVPDVMESLRANMFVRRQGQAWQAHGLVRQAVRRHLGEQAVDWLATSCAEYLAAVLCEGPEGHDPASWKLLVRHARYLLDQPVIAEATVKALLPIVAAELREEGHPASAARLLQRLIALGAETPDLAVDAASDHYDAGEYEEAEMIAGRTLTAEPTRANVLLSCVRAASLDALGRYNDAEPYWLRATVSQSLGVLSEAERVKVRLRWIRGQRLRGVLKENLPELEKVLAAASDLPESLGLLARIELAHIEMATDEQEKARTHAKQVLDHYRSVGRQNHAAAIEAAYVLATAQLRLQFTEFRAAPDRWKEAEDTFRRLAEKQEADLGSRNVDVLACRVNIDFALMSRGKPKEALESIKKLLPVLHGRLDERHPIVLREYFVQGLSHQQLADFDKAVDVLERAHSGQLAVLGIAHPETLQTQFEFAMALRLRDHGSDQRRAIALLDEVVERAKKITGWLNDLPWQAYTGAFAARWAPLWLLRRAHKDNHKHKW
ncbi:toll/interleukin-1 receptor domain-containing protein [Lentzea cavernae]|uniref:TIR domain-containing protein n=1 Tax=Lentzea cavernae TaxID=2020703 RepID=A0ABQ3MSM0_9PSEU|nr:toll/interleukin-1 receptor domain-containing protein [Lentzea cavernae]GHH57974.1 hypothetical protein GCM10017774_78640 [Lentzea cavernae]